MWGGSILPQGQRLGRSAACLACRNSGRGRATGKAVSSKKPPAVLGWSRTCPSLGRAHPGWPFIRQLLWPPDATGVGVRTGVPLGPHVAVGLPVHVEPGGEESRSGTWPQEGWPLWSSSPVGQARAYHYTVMWSESRPTPGTCAHTLSIPPSLQAVTVTPTLLLRKQAQRVGVTCHTIQWRSQEPSNASQQDSEASVLECRVTHVLKCCSPHVKSHQPGRLGIESRVALTCGYNTEKRKTGSGRND